MAVYRSFYRMMKAALFALLVIFVSVFYNNSFADSSVVDYFAVKIAPEFTSSQGYQFSFSMSAAGCYSIDWDCQLENGEYNCAGAASPIETTVGIQEQSGVIVPYGLNIDSSLIRKASTGQMFITKVYPDSNERYVVLKRSTRCSDSSFSGYSPEHGVIVFSGASSGEVKNNTSVLEIEGSLGAVFHTEPKIWLGSGDLAASVASMAKKQPSFKNVFKGCVNLRSTNVENGYAISPDLFKGVTGVPSDAMFSESFAGCEKLSGTLPADLFKGSGLNGAITSGMFNSTFYGCKNLEGDIPPGIFDNFNGATQPQMFYRTFFGCEKLTGIPSGLFYNFGEGCNRDPFANQSYSEVFAGDISIGYLYDSNGNKIHYIPNKFFGEVCTNNAAARSAVAGAFLGVPRATLTSDNKISDGILERAAISDQQSDNCKWLGDNWSSNMAEINKGLYREQGNTNTDKLTCKASGSGGEPSDEGIRTIAFYKNCYTVPDDNAVDYSHINNVGIHHPDFIPNDPLPEPIFYATAQRGRGVPSKTNSNTSITFPEGGCDGYVFAGYSAVEDCNNNKITKQYYDAQSKGTGGGWKILSCPNPDSSDTEHPTIEYLEMYAMWVPNSYHITLNNRYNDTTTGSAIAAYQSGPGYYNGNALTTLHEEYLSGFYFGFDWPKQQVDKNTSLDDGTGTNIQIPKQNIPWAYGYDFMGYYDSKRSDARQIIDADGKFTAGAYEYKTKAIKSNDIVLYARWNRKTLIDFKCSQTGVKIQDTINKPGDTVSFSVEDSVPKTFVNEVSDPSVQTVESKCGLPTDWENKDMRWQCLDETNKQNNKTIYMYNEDGSIKENVYFNSDSYQITCWPIWVPKVYTITLKGNNGRNADGSGQDETEAKIYVEYDIQKYVTGYDVSSGANKGYYLNYNPQTGALSDSIFAVKEDLNNSDNVYIPTHGPYDNYYGVFEGYYTERNSGEKILNTFEDNHQKVIVLPSITTFPRDITLYAHYVNSETLYGFKCTDGAMVFVKQENISNDQSSVSVPDVSGAVTKYACIGGGEDFYATKLCHTKDDVQWRCKKNYKDGTYDEIVYYNPAAGNQIVNGCAANQIQTNGFVESVECVSKELPAVYDIELVSNSTDTENIIIQESYGDKFYYSDVEIPYQNMREIKSDFSRTRCDGYYNFIGYYENNTFNVQNQLYVASNGDIIMNASTFETSMIGSNALGPSCILQNTSYVSLFCDENKTKQIGDTTNLNISTAPEFLSPDNLNLLPGGAVPYCQNALESVNRGNWICDYYTLDSGGDVADSFDLDYKITDTDWANKTNSQIYRIDCYPVWEDRNFVVNLNLGTASGQSGVVQGTDKLYGVHAVGLYYDEQHNQDQELKLNESLAEEPTWTNYLFDGYYDENGNLYINPKRENGTIFVDSENNINRYNDLIYSLKNIDLYAHWTRIYKIILDPNSGVPGKITELYTDKNEINSNKDFLSTGFVGSRVTGEAQLISSEGELPTRTGYEFVGYNNSNGKTMINADGDFTTPLDDRNNNAFTEIQNVSVPEITWYAQWAPKQYDVVLYQNADVDDEINYTVSATYDAIMPTKDKSGVVLQPAKRDGYTFLGYFDEPDAGVKYYNADMSPVSDVIWTKDSGGELYAQWSLDEYNIEYVLDGGTNNPENPTTYKYTDDTINILSPTKKYYTFKGWCDNSNPNCTPVNTDYRILHNSYGDKTLYARWEANTYNIQYHLHTEDFPSGGYNGAVATNNNPQEYTVEDLNIDLQPAIWNGFVFKGWYSDANYTDRIESIQNVSNDTVHLHAQWETISCIKDEYFDFENNICSRCPDYYPYSDLTGLHPISKCYATLEKYDYEDQNNILSENPNQNIWNYSDARSTGIPVSEISVPERMGYNFDKWTNSTDTHTYQNNETLQDGDNKIYVHYTAKPIEYKIYCNSNKNGSLGSKTLPFKQNFNISDYESRSLLSNTCSEYANQDIQGWTCGHDGAEFVDYSTGADISWTTDYNNIISCYARWTPAVFKIVFDHNNTTNETDVVYLKYNDGFYTDAETTHMLNPSSVGVPYYPGHGFIGYCQETQSVSEMKDDAEDDICVKFTNNQGDFNTAYLNKTSFSRNNLDEDNEIKLYAHWINEYYNITLLRNGGNGGIDALYISDGNFYTDQSFAEKIGDITDEARLRQSDLPTKEQNAFAGYKSNDVLMVKQNGDLTPEGKEAIRNITANLEWTAQWEPIHTIELNNNGGEDGEEVLNYIYTDADGIGIYKDIFFTNENLIGKTNDTSVLLSQSVLPTKTHYNFVGYENANNILMIDNMGAFVNLDAVANINSAFTVWNAKWEYFNCVTEAGNGKDRGEYFDELTNSCKYCPSEYPYSDKEQGESISENDCYKKEYCPGPEETQIACKNKDNLATKCSYKDAIEWKVYPTTPDIEHCFIQIDECAVGYMPSDDKERCIPIQYTINFFGNDNNAEGNMNSMTVSYDPSGSPALNANTFVNQGYSFIGWCKDSFVCDEKIPDKSNAGNLSTINGSVINLYAQWSIDTHYIRYETNGGLLPEGVNNPTPYTINDTIVLSDANKTGYTFLGWCEPGVQKCNNPEKGKTITNSAQDLTFYAQWQTVQYDINYYNIENAVWSENATHPDHYTIESDNIIITNPTRPGYTFLGWCDGNQTCSQPYYKPYEIPTGTTRSVINLYAQWSIDTHYIRYETNGGLLPEGVNNPTAYTINDTIVLSDANKTGYTFLGWCEPGVQNCNNPEKGKTITNSAQDLTFYAQWNQKPLTYVFYCNSDTSGEFLSNGNALTGSEISVPSINTCSEYATQHFDGWKCINNDSTELTYEYSVSKITPALSVTEMVCNAQWSNSDCLMGTYYNPEINSCDNCPIEYPISDNGSTQKSDCYKEEQCDISLLQCPEHASECEYDVMDKWTVNFDNGSYKDNNCKVKVVSCDEGYQKSEDERSCVPVQYTIRFHPSVSNFRGVFVQPQTVRYDEEVKLNKNTYINEHHKFIGWCYDMWCNEPEFEDEELVKNLANQNGAVVTLYAKWEYFDCNDDEYFESGTNSCKNCPAAYPYYDSGNLNSITDCYAKITKHNNVNTDVSENHMNYNHYYSEGFPIDFVMEEPINGYEFEYWTDENGEQIPSNTILNQGDIVIYGIYEANTINYTVYCSSEQQNLLGSASVVYGTDLNMITYKDSVSSCPEYADNVFIGWTCTNKRTKTFTYGDTDNISWTSDSSTNIVCYADWRSNLFTVKFDSNGGVGTKQDVSCHYDDPTCDITNTEISKNGYMFVGWAKEQQSNNADFADKMTENPPYGQSEITLYAVWAASDINLKYDYQDELNTTETNTCVFNESFDLLVPQENARPGYRFMGWKYNKNIQ